MPERGFSWLVLRGARIRIPPRDRNIALKSRPDEAAQISRLFGRESKIEHVPREKWHDKAAVCVTNLG